MLSCRHSFECDCDCHKSPHVHHIVPCCRECPICEARITHGFDKHYEECKKKFQALEEQMKQAK